MRSPGHGIAARSFAEPVAARREMVQITLTMRTRSITSCQTVVRPFVIQIGGEIMGDSFVSYLRVSTDRQGRSGLGIEAQRAAVASYLAGFGAEPIAEFVEVESGKRADRPELTRALTECRVRKATLVIEAIRTEGITSATGIARALNDRGVPTTRGGKWQAVQVQRLERARR